MALRFFHSFSGYGTSQIGTRFNTLTNSPAISSTAGRRGGGALLAPNNTSVAESATKTLDAQSTWVIGVAFKCSALPTATQNAIAVLDAGTVQMAVGINSDGTLSIRRGTTTVATSGSALSAGIFYYIEFKVTIHSSAGTADVRLNGSATAFVTFSGNTQSTGNATANQFRLGSNATAAPSYTFTWCDLYVCDGTGGSLDSFLGDQRVDLLLPTGNGNSSQLVGSDGNSTDNYLLVDETTVNDDTDYVTTATVGNKDTYAMGDITHTPASITAVMVSSYAKKSDAGSRSVANVVRSGGTDYDGVTQALGTSYTYYSDIWTTDPATSAAWTKVGVNAIEAGSKCAA